MRSRVAARMLFLIVALALLTPALAACNTVKGAGKDLQYAGEKTEQLITGEKDGTNPNR